jgi:hypothetical protein
MQNLIRVFPYRFRYAPAAGGTSGSAASFSFVHPVAAAAPAEIVLTAESAGASGIVLSLDGHTLPLSATLRAGWSARFDRGGTVHIADETQTAQATEQFDPGLLDLAPREHSFTLQCHLSNGSRAAKPAALKAEIRILARR